MKVLIQRVKNANVVVEEKKVAEIGQGFLLLVGIEKGDDKTQAEYLAKKTANLRIFEDENEKMNLNLTQVDGEILLVPNFTLYADCSHGFRPSFINALNPTEATVLFDKFIEKVKKELGNRVKTGIFGADMQITQHNDGPITIVIES